MMNFVFKTDDFAFKMMNFVQDGSFFGSYPTINVKQSVESPENRAYGEFQELVRVEIEYQARRLAPHPSMCLYSGNNESPDFANLPLFVATQLGTMQKENTNAVLLPSCPSDGWATLKPLTPRNGYQWTPGECETADGGVATCPHDNHYCTKISIPHHTLISRDLGLMDCLCFQMDRVGRSLRIRKQGAIAGWRQTSGANLAGRALM